MSASEKEEEIDEEVGVPYPNLLESMNYFAQGGVSGALHWMPPTLIEQHLLFFHPHHIYTMIWSTICMYLSDINSGCGVQRDIVFHIAPTIILVLVCLHAYCVDILVRVDILLPTHVSEV